MSAPAWELDEGVVRVVEKPAAKWGLTAEPESDEPEAELDLGDEL